MANKNWFKIETNKISETYHYIGSSPETLESLTAKAQAGEFLRLDDLLYMERGDYREWAEWDKSLTPSVMIQPSIVLSIMQFKGDPRVIPSK